MNLIDQFWWIICQILKKNCENDKIYFNNVRINDSKMKYNNKNFYLKSDIIFLNIYNILIIFLSVLNWQKSKSQKKNHIDVKMNLLLLNLLVIMIVDIQKQQKLQKLLNDYYIWILLKQEYL